jgi:hypothetical protein
MTTNMGDLQTLRFDSTRDRNPLHVTELPSDDVGSNRYRDRAAGISSEPGDIEWSSAYPWRFGVYENWLLVTHK